VATDFSEVNAKFIRGNRFQIGGVSLDGLWCCGVDATNDALLPTRFVETFDFVNVSASSHLNITVYDKTTTWESLTATTFSLKVPA
jgi:hypothetical protein